MDRQELTERLAEKEHASWSHWMTYLFSVCAAASDGSVVIPAHLAERWQKQAKTSYVELSEKEKQSDRNRVNHILPIIDEYASKDEKE